MQEVLDAPEAQAVGSGEEDGGGAVAVGGDQASDVAVIEAVSQAPRRLSRSISGCTQGWRPLLCGKIAGHRLVSSASKR